MQQNQAAFARGGSLFYDIPFPPPSTRSTPLTPATGVDWSSWVRADNGVWVSWHPVGAALPAQGWKIHVSATLDTIDTVLREVSLYCGSRGLAFKHVRDVRTLALQNGKDADRGSAGKAITLYPPDETVLREALEHLDPRIGGTAGPYVLSDLRWNAGPLYVRYGAFLADWTRGANGLTVPALRAPDGAAQEDRRDPRFTPPPWIALPDFLQFQRDRLGDGSRPDGFDYDELRPLHYSNAGGVYSARDRDGTRVVLKEARAHAGLTPDGRDAIARLRDEEDRLRRLAGPGVVGVRDSFEAHGHRFLVLDHVEGRSLQQETTARTPMIRADATPTDYLEYRQWALGIADTLDAVLARVHAAGFTHGDLHPGNILITADDEVVLIDFELSTAIADAVAPEFGAAGFVPADGRGGLEADLYALACVKLALFCPLTALLPLDIHKVNEMLDYARERFALDDSWLASLHTQLVGRASVGRAPSRLARHAETVLQAWDVASDDGLSAIQVMIGRSLSSSADFSRADRLWPGDPSQFPDNGFGLAHGAAGVLHALDACGLDLDPLALDWLDAATDDALHADTPMRVGLYDGIAGVAWLARRLGRHDHADALVSRLRAVDPDALGDDLAGGLAGLGLFHLAEAGRDARRLEDARQLGALLHARREGDNRQHHEQQARRRGGLMHGPSGVALFALRLFEATGDPGTLRFAIDTLDEDLARCQTAPDGSLQLHDGRRLLPYLGAGSGGIGLVAAQLLPHVPNPDRYRSVVKQVAAAASVPFTLEPGLFQGRAGLIHLLIAFDRLGVTSPHAIDAVDEHVRALRLHAIRHGAGIAFPGAGLLRLSCDLATGSAGILTALQAYSDHSAGDPTAAPAELLPLLLPPTSTAALRPIPEPHREEVTT